LPHSPHSAASGYSFRSVDSAGLEQVRGVVEGVVDDLFQGYDEIDVIELQFDADFDSIDHAAMKQAVVDNFRIMGLTEERINLLKITLRPGRVVVQISGPVHILQSVNELPLSRMVCLGYQAKVLQKAGQTQSPVVHSPASLERVTQSLTTRSGGFNDLVAPQFREEAAREVVQGIANSIEHGTNTPPSAHSVGLEETVTAQLEATDSRALRSLTDDDIRVLVKEALDAWFSAADEVA